MTETTEQYFNREKEARLLLEDYLNEDDKSLEKLEIAQKILGGDLNEYLEYEEDEDTKRQVVSERLSDWDGIDEAIRNYYEPLEIKKYVSVNPYTNEVINADDCMYHILITFGGPNVSFDIERSAVLNLYWGSEHFSRDFGASFVDTLLSFYGLE